uniref:Uncharacterized protein n=1 Tax=Candidatus Kentrum sp. DK TaxID=2126562 RepID=A0A450STE9_9GAMM|nr:MAG: hypothetical protein BECKDK2373B_GA0170837_10651 [Candidatus Kentron sp. DK]
MWRHLITMTDSDFGKITGLWFARDGEEWLLLTERETCYWSLAEGRALWTIPEVAGGEGISPDGRVYRDMASGLFYPLLGAHGGKLLREHPAGGRIAVDDGTGAVTVTDPDGSVTDLSQGEDFGNWRVAGFCESGERVFVAGPRCLVVHGKLSGR